MPRHGLDFRVTASFKSQWRKCPCASAETSVRRERPVKEEEEKEEGSDRKEDGYKALAAETWKVPKSQ